MNKPQPNFFHGMGMIALMLCISIAVNAQYYEVDETCSIPYEGISSGLNTKFLDDDDYFYIELPFDFTFFGVEYTAPIDLTIHSNGYITLNDQADDYDYGYCLPANLDYINAGIFPFWDNLNPEDGPMRNPIHWKILGEAPNRRLVIMWDNINHDNLPSDESNGVTFEVILWESNSHITFLYQDGEFGNSDYDFGASATIGLQSDWDGPAVQYACEDPNAGLGSTVNCLNFIPQSSAPFYTIDQSCAIPFEDLTISENIVLLDDDDYFYIQLPFDFNFFGIDYPAPIDLSIHSNGYISFNEQADDYTYNECIPANEDYIFAAIFPFWDNLDPSENNAITYWKVLGEAPNRRLVIGWIDICHEQYAEANCNGATFEVVLWEGSSEITFIYEDTDVGDADNSEDYDDEYDFGATVSVGLQGDSYGPAVEVACENPDANLGNTVHCLNFIPIPPVTVVPHLTVACMEQINPNPDWAEVFSDCDSPYQVDIYLMNENDVIENCPGKTYTYRYTATNDCRVIGSADQTFTIQNDDPSMDCPDNCEVFGCYDGNAQAVIDAWINTVTATSSCNDALTVYHEIEDDIGTCISNGITPITFRATDDCNRTVSCESLIIIIDDDEPSFTEQPADLLVPCTYNTYGDFEDWLNDHGSAAAYDDCDQSLEWSYEPEDALELLDCDNGPQAIIVTFTAEDDCGNTASATATFSTKLLPNQVNVAGLIQTEAAEAVAAVEVAAYQSNGMTAMDVSDDTGDYGFEELPFEENTQIVPARTDDWINGLSTYDLILLQLHILGLQELDSPYKRIAADANRSGNISTLDLVLLRRLILLIDEELEDNTSWRFVDADFVFLNAQDPFESEFPEAYSLSGEEEDWASFVAVKIGDLNLDAATNSFNTNVDDRSGLEDLVFQIEDQKLQAGQEYEIEINAANFEAIRGFQMTLEYNHSLISVLDIVGDALPEFSAANYNLAFTEQGSVPMSWNTQRAESLSSEDVALRILIKAKANVNLSEVLAVSSILTRAEAYNETALMNVALHFTNNGTSVAADRFELFQNQPNPFMDATMIGFVIPEAGAVTLEVFHISGKLVYQQRSEYVEGYNQIDLDRAGLPGGVYYYKVSTELLSRSKKMIVLE